MEVHFTAFQRASLLAMLGGLPACGASDDAALRITTHVLAACPIESALAAGQSLVLTPLGDFPESAALEVELVPRRARSLDVPPATLAFAAATERPFDGFRFLGFAERGAHTWVPILLWPEGVACPLGGASTAAARYPAPGGGQAVGYAAAERLLLIVGGRSPEAPSAAEGALTFDAGTGELALVEGSSLEEPRAFASVSRLGDRLLVAGGENPLRGDDPSGVVTPSATAEPFDPVERRFTGALVELSVERTRHAAVTLANGDTLLVGGRGPFGALRALEIISAESGRASIAGLAALGAPRLFPAVLRLDDERWFVGGGTALDGTPLAVVEWLSADARENLGAAAPLALQPRVDRAFVALPGGGVLAVGGCVDREPASDAETAACRAACSRGCPPERYDAIWIAPDGAATELADFGLDAPRPVLLGGADGRPLLSTGRGADAQLYRFDPWSARFEVADALVSPAPRAGSVSASLDAEAFVWLGEGEVPALFGLRTGTRSRYGAPGELFRASAGAWPRELVPDRPIDAELALGPGGELVFAADSAVAVYAAGADYAGFTLEIEASAPPRVVLGTEQYGGVARPFPSGPAALYTVTRLGATVTLDAGGASADYTAPEGRLRVGVGAPAEGATLTRVTLERVAE